MVLIADVQNQIKGIIIDSARMIEIKHKITLLTKSVCEKIFPPVLFKYKQQNNV